MIAFVYPSEARFYEDCLGDNWRVEIFGPNVEVHILKPIPDPDKYKPNKYTVRLPAASWRLLNRGES